MHRIKQFVMTWIRAFAARIRTLAGQPYGPFLLLGIGLAVLVSGYLTCTTILMQGEIGVILRFGKPVRVMQEPGLYLKLPYPIHRLHTFDGRLLMLEPRPSEFLTADKKNLVLENSICYRISDPILFMKTVRDKEGLEIRLSDLLSSYTGLLLGVRELSEIVNVDKELLKFADMNQELTDMLKQESRELGIDVKQVFIKRVMLPSENAQAVYERMRAERNRIARKYVAEGEEMAMKIRSEADKQSREMIADANRQAAMIRSQSEARAMKLYGETYQHNLPFYKYLRTLEAYRNMFNEQTTIILDEESPILTPLFSGAHNANE